jgi:hypothetical protein
VSRSLRELVSLGSVIAEREFLLERAGESARPIRVQIGAPVVHPDRSDQFLCPVVIHGFPREEKLVLGGADTMQALVCALQALPAFLQACAQQYGGSLSWLGGSDIGFQ